MLSDRWTGSERYEIEAELYDKMYDLKEDIPLYEQYAKDCKGSVLECGCGTGRILIPLARMGKQVVGIDLSASMLRMAKSKISKEPLEVRRRIRLINANIRNFSLSEHFDLCIIAYSSFLHMMTVEDEKAALISVNKHLVQGGRLILDVFNPALSRLQNVPKLDKVKQVGDRTILRFTVDRFNTVDQTNDGYLFYDVCRGNRLVETIFVPSRVRYLFKEQIEELLSKTGYKVEEVFGRYDRSPFERNSPLIITVAKKL